MRIYRAEKQASILKKPKQVMVRSSFGEAQLLARRSRSHASVKT